MSTLSRRSVLKTGAAAGALAAIGWPDWLLPALAQGETVVPFTDIPANFCHESQRARPCA